MILKMASADIAKNLKFVLDKIALASSGTKNLAQPRLVAVSKTKPITMIKEAYDYGQRHFGENYVQEILEKSQDKEIQISCPDIRWHFIGHLQTNKVKKIITVPNLYVVETVDSEKLALALDTAWSKASQAEPLRIMIQVNTSGEEAKSGCQPNEVSQLVSYVLNSCRNLKLIGLMTIGSIDHDPASGPNQDFVCLARCREDLCKQLGLDESQVELSMGMSSDFEHAIAMGSTSVRVGSTIFGNRNYNPPT